MVSEIKGQDGEVEAYKNQKSNAFIWSMYDIHNQ